MRGIKTLLSMICMALLLSASAQANPLKRFNTSVWTDYTRMDFDNLTQDEKTHKLQCLFEDKANFCEKYNVRRAMIRILDPASFDFFNPENFDGSRDDNFYYWAVHLSKVSEVEAVFDIEPFRLGPATWGSWMEGKARTFFKIETSLRDFHNFVEKLEWVTLANDMYDPTYKKGPLIKSITINSQGIDDELTQRVINALDQYKYNASEAFPQNNFPTLRIGMSFNIDQKKLLYSNLSRFPLYTDIRGNKPNAIGIKVPKHFPGVGPTFLAPEWRPNNNASLLDTAYLNLADKRLVESIYQNHEVLPNPSIANEDAVKTLVICMGMNFRGGPFVKGPGLVTILKGTSDVQGHYTFFKTGSLKSKEGQFIRSGIIELRPPYVESNIKKVVVANPISNKNMKVTSSFSTTTDIIEAEYYYTATPTKWHYPKVSNFLSSKIYYVFSTDFDPDNGRFMGNWHLDNFIDFFQNQIIQTPRKKNAKNQKQIKKTGFLYNKMFLNLSKQWQTPTNNIVIHDFTTIPNGKPYPEVNWKLGNKVHE